MRFFRKLLQPFLKLLFNPNPLNQVLHQQVGHQPLPGRPDAPATSCSTKSAQPGRGDDARQHRRQEHEDARGVHRQPARVQRAAGARPGSGGPVSARRRAGTRSRPRSRPRPGPRRGRTSRAHSASATPQPAPAGPGPVDPITGGDSLRSRRKRRRRGRRSGPGFGDEASGLGASQASGASHQASELRSRPRRLRPGLGGRSPEPGARGLQARSLRPELDGVRPSRETRGRRPALRRGHQRRGGAARAVRGRAPGAPRRGGGLHDLRARLRHLGQRAA